MSDHFSGEQHDKRWLERAIESLDGGLRASAWGEQLLRTAAIQLSFAMETERIDGVGPAHALLDQLGALLRRRFGCRLEQDGEVYRFRCAVGLGHIRAGFSPGYVHTLRCSVCGVDPNDCPHREGEAYNGVVATYEQISDESELSEHYAIVDTPRFGSLGRFPELFFTNEQLSTVLGPGWSPGDPVGCDRCLHPCSGLVSESELLSIRFGWLSRAPEGSGIDSGITVRLDGLVFGPDGSERVNLRDPVLSTQVRDRLMAMLRGDG